MTTLNTDLDVTIKGEQNVSASMDMAINVKFIQQGVDVLIYEGNGWDYALEMSKLSGDPCLRPAVGSRVQCVLLGDPVTRHYYIDDGSVVESSVSEIPESANPMVVTAINVWPMDEERVRILVCDHKMLYLLSQNKKERAGNTAVIERSENGYNIKFVWREAPEEAHSQMYDLRSISIERLL